MAEAAAAAFNSAADSEVPVVAQLRQQAATTSSPLRVQLVSACRRIHTTAQSHMYAPLYEACVAMLAATGPDSKLFETSLRDNSTAVSLSAL